MSGIDSLDLFQCMPAYQSTCFGILGKLTAVMEYRVPVAGHVDIRLDDVCSLLEGEANSCERMVGCVGRSTAVGEDEWLTRKEPVPRAGEGPGSAAARRLRRTAGVRRPVSGP